MIVDDLTLQFNSLLQQCKYADAVSMLQQNESDFSELFSSSFISSFLYHMDVLKMLTVKQTYFLFEHLNKIPIDYALHCVWQIRAYGTTMLKITLETVLFKDELFKIRTYAKSYMHPYTSTLSFKDSKKFDKLVVSQCKTSSLVDIINRIADSKSIDVNKFAKIMSHSIFINAVYNYRTLVEVNDLAKWLLLNSFNSAIRSSSMSDVQFKTYQSVSNLNSSTTPSIIRDFIFSVFCSAEVNATCKSILYRSLVDDDELVYHSAMSNCIFRMSPEMKSDIYIDDYDGYPKLLLKMSLNYPDYDKRSLLIYLLLNKTHTFEQALEIDKDDVEAMIPYASQMKL